MGRWARKPVNQTSWVTLVTPTDRPKSVRNRCLIELFCGVVCVVTLPFWHFCWCRGFCHRTESDLLLFCLCDKVIKKNCRSGPGKEQCPEPIYINWRITCCTRCTMRRQTIRWQSNWPNNLTLKLVLYDSTWCIGQRGLKVSLYLILHICGQAQQTETMVPSLAWMVLQIWIWPHFFSTSGAIVPTPSLAFPGTGGWNFLINVIHV